MTVVVDASVLCATLDSEGSIAYWAADQLTTGAVFAPHILHAEVASYLRRAERLGQISRAVAALAHADLTSLAIELLPYEPFAERVWQLRHAVTPYDAWYVAIAEAFDAPLATLDQRLANASGPRCTFRTPPG
jgi:predicted nucleic acid-binding protein